MSTAPPLETISVGIVVERSKTAGPWTEHLWRPLSILTGVPETPAWTKLSDDGTRATFYAGAADIELYRTETAHYRDNLTAEIPLLWVVLRPTEADPPYTLLGVTADPAEGEAWAGIGNDIVETLPMPKSIQETVAAFVSAHHVEQAFGKRKRDRVDPEAMARRAPLRNNGKS